MGIAATIASGEPPFGWDTTIPSLIMLFTLIVLALYGAHVNEIHSRERWQWNKQSEIQAVALDKGHEAMSRILNRFCECVIVVNKDMRIIEPNQFAALMLLQGDSVRLENRHFFDFVASEEDKSVIEGAVRRCEAQAEST